MRVLFAAWFAAVAACSFRLPDAANPDPPGTDAPAIVRVDAPAVTPPADTTPPDMPPPDAAGGQHCSQGFTLDGVHVRVDCDTDHGSSTCQCFREDVLEKTCTSFSFAPCSLPTCCNFL
jgi:hypothetical protein